jgi:hypothetical protein
MTYRIGQPTEFRRDRLIRERLEAQAAAKATLEAKVTPPPTSSVDAPEAKPKSPRRARKPRRSTGGDA